MGNVVGWNACCSVVLEKESVFSFSPRPLVTSFEQAEFTESLCEAEIPAKISGLTKESDENSDNALEYLDSTRNTLDSTGHTVFNICVANSSKELAQENVTSQDENDPIVLPDSPCYSNVDHVNNEDSDAVAIDSVSESDVIFKLNNISLASQSSFKNDLVFFNSVPLEDETTIYTGQWRGKKPEGYGILVNSSGEYQGKFKNGLAEGPGKFANVNGSVYIGNWHENKSCGFGVFKQNGGIFYAGEWLNNLQHGAGKEIAPDGTIYVGSFAYGMKHGQGRLEWPGSFVYEGNFSKNRLNGMGAYKWPDGKIYAGFWDAGRSSGYGTLEWPDGKVFTGWFENCDKHGTGILQYASGNRFAGVWSQNAPHGVMVSISQNGNASLNLYKDGKFLRILTEAELESHKTRDEAKVEPRNLNEQSNPLDAMNSLPVPIETNSYAATSAEASLIETTSSSTEEVRNVKSSTKKKMEQELVKIEKRKNKDTLKGFFKRLFFKKFKPIPTLP